MKRLMLLAFLVMVHGVSVYAGGEIEVSSIQKKDIDRLDSIVGALEPTYAIKEALRLYPDAIYPMHEYMKVQEMKINAIFNEYGIVYNSYNTYTVSDNQRLQIILAKLKSRYHFLDSIGLTKKDSLLSTLESLK